MKRSPVSDWRVNLASVRLGSDSDVTVCRAPESAQMLGLRMESESPAMTKKAAKIKRQENNLTVLAFRCSECLYFTEINQNFLDKMFKIKRQRKSSQTSEQVCHPNSRRRVETYRINLKD